MRHVWGDRCTEKTKQGWGGKQGEQVLIYVVRGRKD